LKKDYKEVLKMLTKDERKERQRKGIETKKTNGEWDDYGRPRIMSIKDFERAYKSVKNGKKKSTELMKELKLTKPTFYRYIRQIENK
jgi:DNA invertase Pin-like site-specific DNA recombinase